MFQTTLAGMLSTILVLRLRQARWAAAYWLRALGLLPESGKWMERITFVYIYVLVIGVVTPAIVGLLNGLYVLESKASGELMARTMTVTLPAIIAIVSLLLMVLPWRAWMLRLTFGDMTYMAPSPFDRRVLALWRFIEVLIFIAVITIIPLTLLAPLFGSILFVDAFAAVLRGLLAMSLWCAPMLALGWHLSMQEYIHDAPPGLVRTISRLALIAAAGVLLVNRPDALLWPGRLIVLLAHGEALWGWPLLIAYAGAALGVIWLTSRRLSLTRAAAGAETFARIQRLGFMILVDRQLLVSILGEARASESRAVSVLPRASGIWTAVARSALFYRRQYGQALQLFGLGAAFGFGLIFWRPLNIAVVVVTVLLLTLAVPPTLAQIFRLDQGVPFISQFIPQPISRRVLASSLAPALLLLAGMLPVLIGFNSLLPDYVWGLVPVVWVLALAGHVELVGKHGALSERSLVSVLVSSAAVFAVFWAATSAGFPGPFGLVGGGAVALSVTFVLMFVVEMRNGGLNAVAQERSTS